MEAFLLYLYMINGKKKIELTIESILKFVSSYDIFYKWMPKGWKPNVVTYSPFRNEQNPSFVVGNKFDELTFIDFTTGQKGDCFTFVKYLFNLNSIDDVLRIIDKEFDLGIISGSSTQEYKKIISEYKQPEELGKRYSLIQCITKPFTKDDINYWGSYFQDVSDLRANNIYSLKKIYLNKQLYSIKNNELVFGYLYNSLNWKIYFPGREKKGKWLSNVPLSTSYGLENLDRENNSLITKSLKDYLVCRKIYPYVSHVQNESLSAFSEETIEHISNNSKRVFYGGDSDKAGKEASYIITNTLGYKHINPPDRLLPQVKDFSDWAKKEQLKTLEEYFKQKKLI